MTQVTDTDIRDLRDLIAKLDSKLDNLETKFERKLDKLDNKIDNLETKLTGQIDGDFRELRAEVKALDTKFDERTKGIGQRLDGKELVQRNLSIGTTVVVVGGLLLAFAKYLFFGTNS